MRSLVRQYSGSLLLIIIAFAYLTRIFQLNIPEEYVFDEVYHAVTAKLIAQNDPQAFEWWNPAPEPDTAVDWLHPPFAKYTQAVMIQAFGENSFGWRFSSVIFGVLVIVLTYHLVLQLTDHVQTSLLAAGLASLDGLLLVQSRIAMNDIHVTFFILLSLLVYVLYRQKRDWRYLVATGVIAGLAVATKWSGIFVVGFLLGHQLLLALGYLFKIKWKLKRIITRNNLRQLSDSLGIFLLLPALIYLLSYSQMFLQGKDWQHFVELHKQIWYYQTNLDATHPYQSRPWQWALNLRPVWYHVDYLDEQRADIYAIGNPVLYWTGLAAIGISIFIGILNIQEIFNKRNGWLKKIEKVIKSASNSPLFFLSVAYAVVWMPWLFSPRIMFFYHYTPAVPLLCAVLSIWLYRIYNEGGTVGKVATLSVISLSALFFIVWYPHLVALPISTEFKDAVYFRFDSWR